MAKRVGDMDICVSLGIRSTVIRIDEMAAFGQKRSLIAQLRVLVFASSPKQSHTVLRP